MFDKTVAKRTPQFIPVCTITGLVRRLVLVLPSFYPQSNTGSSLIKQESLRALLLVDSILS